LWVDNLEDLIIGKDPRDGEALLHGENLPHFLHVSILCLFALLSIKVEIPIYLVNKLFRAVLQALQVKLLCVSCELLQIVIEWVAILVSLAAIIVDAEVGGKVESDTDVDL
jgi:hypothetical protein